MGQHHLQLRHQRRFGLLDPGRSKGSRKPVGVARRETPRVKRFIVRSAQLERRLTGVRVEMWDERLTTVEAERTMISDGVRRRRRKTAVDPIAAALILQGYLDSRHGAPS